MAKYDPLAAYLSALAGRECALTFGQVEEIIGARLPPGAGTKWWWANVRGRSQSKAWLSAGWRCVGVDRVNKMVRFERSTPPQPAGPPETSPEVAAAAMLSGVVVVLGALLRQQAHSEVPETVETLLSSGKIRPVGRTRTGDLLSAIRLIRDVRDSLP